MPSPTSPNFLVFFVDQQRWDTTGLQGYPAGLTPNFDRLATQGTYFRHAVTPQPVCGPARSCLQTGQYATTTGVWRNGPGLKADAPKLAEILGDAGYHTAYFGKWHLSEGTGNGAVPPENRGGYQEWLGANCVELTSGPSTARLWDHDGNEVRLPGYRVDGQTDAMLRWLTRQSEKAAPTPFLCFHSFLEPHHQNTDDSYPAPPGYEDLYRYAPLPPDLQALGGSSSQHWAGYCGMIKRLDEALGRTMDVLESTGLAENTVVIYISDHGCHFKTRNSEYKRSPHESSVRVPMGIWGPGWYGGGQREEAASLVDLMPTLLDCAGVRIPEDVQGRSLLPLTKGSAPADWPDDTFIQFGDGGLPPGRCLRSNRWKYAVTASEEHTGHAHAPEYTETQLYDLRTDPYELTNLVCLDSHADLRRQLAGRLLKRMQDIGEPPARILPAPSVHGGQRTVEYPGS